jgi:hypothetical protein
VPTETQWSYPGNPKFALAEDWLAQPIPTGGDRQLELVKRYLAAFGPASPKDMETWSYLSNLAPAFEALRSGLVVYHDECGRELFDLPGLELEPEDAPAPVRFLPEFDNLLLSHQDRTRFVPQAARKAVYLPGLRIAATVLIDGFVAATWTTQRAKNVASLRIALIGPPPKLALRKELAREGERLLRFVEPGAGNYEVRIGDNAQ